MKARRDVMLGTFASACDWGSPDPESGVSNGRMHCGETEENELRCVGPDSDENALI